MESNHRRGRSSRRPQLVVNVSHTKYPVVRDCAGEMNWVISEDRDDEESWTIWWMDATCSFERVLRLSPYQYINHFPGMTLICRKVSLCRAMRRMRRLFPRSFRFSPQSWILPSDIHLFQRSRRLAGKIFIVKPNTGCQGRGIVVTSDPAEVIRHGSDAVVQIYIDRPFLLNGYKFDLRVYCLVTRVRPHPVVYYYNDGLVRMCTEKWAAPTVRNLKNSFMHLTNYAINKKNTNFVSADADGGNSSKKDFGELSAYLEESGHDAALLWRRVKGVCLKTIISIAPQLQHTYEMCVMPNGEEKCLREDTDFACFEILGFDILLDTKLNPWVLEVNHSASFATDSELDRRIKGGLIKETMELLAINPFDVIRMRRNEREQRLRRIRGEMVARGVIPKKKKNGNENGNGNGGGANPAVSSSENGVNASSDSSGGGSGGSAPYRKSQKEIEDYRAAVEKRVLRNWERVYPSEEYAHYSKFIEGAKRVFKKTSLTRSQYSELSLSVAAARARGRRRTAAGASASASSSRISSLRSHPMSSSSSSSSTSEQGPASEGSVPASKTSNVQSRYSHSRNRGRRSSAAATTRRAVTSSRAVASQLIKSRPDRSARGSRRSLPRPGDAAAAATDRNPIVRRRPFNQKRAASATRASAASRVLPKARYLDPNPRRRPPPKRRTISRLPRTGFKVKKVPIVSVALHEDVPEGALPDLTLSSAGSSSAPAPATAPSSSSSDVPPPSSDAAPASRGADSLGSRRQLHRVRVPQEKLRDLSLNELLAESNQLLGRYHRFRQLVSDSKEASGSSGGPTATTALAQRSTLNRRKTGSTFGTSARFDDETGRRYYGRLARRTVARNQRARESIRKASGM